MQKLSYQAASIGDLLLNEKQKNSKKADCL